jgi:hypothetical protein
MVIVLETEKNNFLDASCWRVDVVKGAVGLFFAGFFIIFFTINSELIFCFKKTKAFP